jgi:hypothetical protein
MKARVIETGEIIEVQSLYSPIYSRLDCNGKIISEYDEDELEFISNPNKPKMVPLDKVCKYLKTLVYQEYPGGPLERKIDDNDLEKLRKIFE